MSELKPFDFGQMLPGFDFLQKLAASGAGATGPAAWALPTVDVEELDKRITELKAVQFWLEQNLVALKATVQALEVQKMTLTALRSMNLGMGEIAKAFALSTEEAADAAEGAVPAEETAAPGGHDASSWPYSRDEAAAQEEPPAPAAEAEPTPRPARAAKRASRAGAATRQAAVDPEAAAAVTDPMLWWGALTQQFQQIATEALQEAARAMPMAADEAPQESADSAAGARRATASRKKPAAGKKTTARKSASAKTAARKTPARKSAARKKARPAPEPEDQGGVGWPLPTPFKFGSR